MDMTVTFYLADANHCSSLYLMQMMLSVYNIGMPQMVKMALFFVDSPHKFQIYCSLNPLRAAVENSGQCGTSSSHGGREKSTEKHQPVSEGISWEP